jgi:uncharacterized protein (DUF1778 family)
MTIAATKDARLDLRLTTTQRQLIERAADLTGSTLAGFAISRLVDDATQVIADAKALALEPDDWDTFIAALDAPDGPVWQRLRARKRTWDAE